MTAKLPPLPVKEFGRIDDDGVEMLVGVAYTTDQLRAYAEEAVRLAVGELQKDADRLDFIQRNRVGLTPEFEGPWDAEVYGEDGVIRGIHSGTTPRHAIDAALNSEAAQRDKDA